MRHHFPCRGNGLAFDQRRVVVVPVVGGLAGRWFGGMLWHSVTWFALPLCARCPCGGSMLVILFAIQCQAVTQAARSCQSLWFKPAGTAEQ